MSAPSWQLPERHPRLAHRMPYIVGDALSSLRWAFAVLKWWGIDQNGLADLDGCVWVMHWPKWRKGGYVRRVVGHKFRGRGKRRRAVEVLGPVPSSWGPIDQLRTSQVAELRTRTGKRPTRAAEHFRELHRLETTHPRAARRRRLGRLFALVLEVKGSPGFRTEAVWARLEHEHQLAGSPRVGVMTLQNLGGDAAALERLELAYAHGFPVALLPRGREFPLPPYVRVWGRWR